MIVLIQAVWTVATEDLEGSQSCHVLGGIGFGIGPTGCASLAVDGSKSMK
jgi:hypothetical protein